jgi:hypothetical protein
MDHPYADKLTAITHHQVQEIIMRRFSLTHISASKWQSAMTSLRHFGSAALILGAMTSQATAQTTISTVDTSLVGSQKYVQRVGGTPYLMNAIQMRFDKVRYYSTYAWDFTQCNALAAQAASDGFNTIIVPIEWYEVEPTENNFSWTILDEYLTIANANNLKMELIWGGTNSDGGVEWLGDSVTPTHLRTPDYVLFAPSYTSTATTSNYEIVSGAPFTLNLADAALQARETLVLGKVMAEVARWDAANGNKHPVIGVQLNNEVQKFSDAEVVDYMNGIGSAIKTSAYSVWTRINTLDNLTSVNARIAENTRLRSGAATNLDFIGIDNYSNTPSVIQGIMPQGANNYAEVMENGGLNSFDIRLAALAGNTALGTYDMLGPDAGNGLYDQVGGPGPTATFTPAGSNITEVRSGLHMLDADPVDLALNAQGEGLFVHNWDINTESPTTGGTLGITYTPSTAFGWGTDNEGISIDRSSTQVVLMSLGGGTFSYPSSLDVAAASTGSFNSSNVWVSTGNVAFTSTSVAMTPYEVVLLTRGSCTPTAITPYISINGGSTWTEESSATVGSTTTAVDLGPQPVSGGSWNWTGPNGYTSTSRQINSIPLTVGTESYLATYTNTSGCKSTQTFTITVN